jgi:hypothetical protein
MMSTDRIRGRSESLSKTIGEVMRFLGDDAKRPGGVGVDLRDLLHRKLGDLSAHWYERGFRRGHIQSYKEFETTGTLSRKLRYKTKREFFEGEERKTRVTSRIRPQHK